MAKREKEPETPLPRGIDTGALGWLTSVGSPELGYAPPPTVERLLMRLRIFWFFFMAIPIAIGGGFVGEIASGLARLLVGQGSAQGDSIVGSAAVVGFVVGLVLFARLFWLWFNRLTRGYRAKLRARAAAQLDAAERAANQRLKAPSRLLDRVSLAELDARLARDTTVDRER